MKNKKIPWWQPRVEKEDYAFIKQALDANFINEGPLAERLEKEIASFLGAKHAVATTSGTIAIFLSLKAVGVGRGDEVIVPDATFIATANAVELTGAKPILVDIDPETLTVSVEAVKKAITSKTKAVVPVHVTGRGADMEKILEIAEARNIFVIEDAAEALGSKHNGKYLGTLGDAGCFSFAANKTLATGQGGMIVTNSDEIFSRLRPLKDQGRPVRGTGGDDTHDTVGYNFRMTDLQAAVGLGQFAHLKERLARMKRNYELYTENLKDIKEIKVFPSTDEETPQWTDIMTDKRDELEKYLRGKNIDCRKYWHPIHRQPPYKLPDDNFPVSTELLPKSLWLPSAFTLTDEDVLRVCEEIKKFFL
ncbi:MAG: DegT/DnrJ/EryC1/StrS aminotransferase [Candidatus Giovannonibacteria bacterium GW2011_GWA1_43_15]|nr:MAG: DegT/DnrJ/EryC1/StrS aminotransferase [Candidatus Giovannonibacteria bacterium GW2011_GWA1_43_15]